MSTEEPTINSSESTVIVPASEDDPERAKKILVAKKLFAHGTRNFYVKCYAEAADELSEACALYGELYGELSEELGKLYLFYAKSLIALSINENKVIDVPENIDENDEDDINDDDSDEDDAKQEILDDAAKKKDVETSVVDIEVKESKTDDNEEKLDKQSENNAPTNEVLADSTGIYGEKDLEMKNTVKHIPADKENSDSVESQISSTNDTPERKVPQITSAPSNMVKGILNNSIIDDGEKPSTSNGDTGEHDLNEYYDDENESASNLQLAWEILELASKIFAKQGEEGLANLAEVHTELGNIEFENSILEAAREDYGKALEIYKKLPSNNRRAMAELHYKIGLTYLMQQMNEEGGISMKEAHNLIEDEINELKNQDNINEKNMNIITDLEETKEEILAKISEVKETQAQNIAEVRAALDKYINPRNADVENGACSSTKIGSTSTTSQSNSKPNDITHLIKRKKCDEPSSEAEASSPAKRAAV